MFSHSTVQEFQEGTVNIKRHGINYFIQQDVKCSQLIYPALILEEDPKIFNFIFIEIKKRDNETFRL